MEIIKKIQFLYDFCLLCGDSHIPGFPGFKWAISPITSKYSSKIEFFFSKLNDYPSNQKKGWLPIIYSEKRVQFVRDKGIIQLSEKRVYFVGDTGITQLSEEWVVGDVYLSEKWDEHQPEITLSEIWVMHQMRTRLSEVRIVGEKGCRRSGPSPTRWFAYREWSHTLVSVTFYCLLNV